MFSVTEKQFYDNTARAYTKLSGCRIGRSAVLVKNHKIIATGLNREIVKNKPWEISAIYDAVFSSRDMDISGSALFCSSEPDFNDFKLIVATGIQTVYFRGAITDPSVPTFLNSLPEADIALELFILQ